MRSRLKQGIKKQIIKTLIIIIGIILVLSIFGTQLLVGFGIMLNKIKGDDSPKIETQSVDYIAPPVINPQPAATKESKITVSGTASADQDVKLYVNGKSAGSEKPAKDGTFSFSDVLLEKGENEIKAKSIASDNKESEYSETVKIKYLNSEPALEIKEPTDGQTFKKDQSPIKISGKTDPGAKVKVNDFWTIISDSGDFYYMYTLKDGGNNLKIVATDEAGNTKAKEVNIKVE